MPSREAEAYPVRGPGTHGPGLAVKFEFTYFDGYF
ncbi:hypothetical protein SAMN05421548_118129 [Paraburkholderia lycopersici]|uniref:Uncharacterized protein n=1 Tax=Paraburkholderia lycopersici TaxID=416944 RepID=A0A1G6UAC2_9BURK|nr:hypothetical protein SAMN05421548_118129 [Paraburkholderia lycopersici]